MRNERDLNEAIFTGVISISVLFASLGFFVSKESYIYIIALTGFPFAIGMLRIYGVILDNQKFKISSELLSLFIVPVLFWLIPLLMVNEILGGSSIFPLIYSITNSTFGLLSVLMSAIILGWVLNRWVEGKFEFGLETTPDQPHPSVSSEAQPNPNPVTGNEPSRVGLDKIVLDDKTGHNDGGRPS